MSAALSYGTLLIMFTGIIQTTATVTTAFHAENFTQLVIKAPQSFLVGLVLGASVSVQGVCLTVTQIQNGEISFDVGLETCQKTTLTQLKPGMEIHIERSLKIGDEIGGHLLSGHVMGIATIAHITDLPTQQRSITLSCDPNLIKYIFTKGYIALNGVSLTVNEVKPAGLFTVHLIPETLKRTCFAKAMIGEKVNVEIDSQTLAVVETVERMLERTNNN